MEVRYGERQKQAGQGKEETQKGQISFFGFTFLLNETGCSTSGPFRFFGATVGSGPVKTAGVSAGKCGQGRPTERGRKKTGISNLSCRA